MVKTVTYSHTNSYEIVNPVVATTKNIWICMHGLGYLATYFKKYFKDLDPAIHAVIVPQAPSKFYMGDTFKNVGACWLTRIDTMQEMDNNLNYLNKVLKQEEITGDPRLVLFGYSQGVSIATRFLKNYHHSIKALIMHSGSIPTEFTAADGAHFKKHCGRFIHISGKRDEYVTPEIIAREKDKIEMLFGMDCEIYHPDIKHIVDIPLLHQIAQSL